LLVGAVELPEQKVAHPGTEDVVYHVDKDNESFFVHFEQAFSVGNFGHHVELVRGRFAHLLDAWLLGHAQHEIPGVLQ